ncbi:DUF3047 domain-containing protein [Ferruginivarius sediminum]|uniref:DUF3047 domain-containing protein n=1 Tax=Ferruginivarius sediminum TaxID=2661937 RepID=A0A369T7H2_9PROT|nr:DUF3047 domain-containing protein [Ferruginivarius sediminum]RDD60127.1 DUF3047 domain-containing protein [Ferruginivarius sediminum]
MHATRQPFHSLLAKPLFKSCAALSLLTLIGSAQPWADADAAEVVETIDFSSPSSGDATAWLKENGFQLRMDAGELNPHFINERLVLETSGQTAGLFVKELSLSDVDHIRISWGVERYPHGADWDKGVYRVPIAVMISFGDKEIKSGNWFVPDVPYFISLFLSESAEEGEAYSANYYNKGGRYFCQPCNAAAGKTITTEFNFTDAFKSEFDKSPVPPITGFGFQMNTEDTQGGARAFLKKVEFLSD